MDAPGGTSPVTLTQTSKTSSTTLHTLHPNPPPTMTGHDIKAVRTRHGWTQQQLADRLGISQVRVSQLEHGDRITRVMALAVLALERIGPGECEEHIHNAT